MPSPNANISPEEAFPYLANKPSIPTIAPTSTGGGNPEQPIPAWWEFLGHKFMQGMAGAKGGYEDAIQASASGEVPILVAARTLGIPRDWVNAISGVKVEGKDYGYDYQMENTTKKDLEHSKNAVLEHIGEGLKAAGGAVMTPFPTTAFAKAGTSAIGVAGNLARNASIGYGAGALGDVSEKVGEGAQRVWNDLVLDKPNDTSGPLGPTFKLAGGLAGGFIGGTVKAGLIAEGSKGAVDLAKGAATATGNIVKAGKEAIQQKRLDDSKSLFRLFTNDFKMFQGAKEGSSGMIDDMVKAKIANALQSDPEHYAKFEEFLKDTGKLAAGENLKDLQSKFDIAQASGNESLAALIRERTERPLSIPSSEAMKAGKKELTGTLKQLANKFGVEASLNSKGVDAAFDELKASTSLALTAEQVKANNIKDSFARPDAESFSSQGKGIKSAYEAEKSVSTAKVNELYGKARSVGDATGIKYDLTPTLEKANSILESSGAVGGKATGPIGPQLRAYLAKEGIQLAEDGGMDLFHALKYSDADNLGKALNRAISDVAHNPAERFKYSNLVDLKKQLNSDILAQSPENVKGLRQQADAFFANEHSPRFREGPNALLDREGASGVKTGMDIVPDVEVMAKYIPEHGRVDESTLAKFDDAFGGKFREGGARREEAYAQLGSYVEGLYRRQVIGEGFSQSAHEKFLENLGPVFKRVPGLEDKINNAATAMLNVEENKALILNNYKELTGDSLPLSRRTDPRTARELLSRALSDPRRMSQLLTGLEEDGIARGAGSIGGEKKSLIHEALIQGGVVGEQGALNSKNLESILYAGAAGDGRPGGFQTLLRATYGPKTGDAMFDKLEALNRLVKRNELTDPRYLRPKDEIVGDPITGFSGQSGPSWISQFYAYGSGRTNPAYLVSTPIARFAVKKLSAKISAAETKLLHTPEGVEALFDLNATKFGDTVSNATINTLSKYTGEGVDRIKKVLNMSGFDKVAGIAAKESTRNLAQDEEAKRKAKEGLSTKQP